MEQIYSPEEYLKFEKISEELKELELIRAEEKALKPKPESVNSILLYSKSLEIRQSKWLGYFENINN